MTAASDAAPETLRSGAFQPFLGARIGLFYAAICFIYGIHLPYLAVWLAWREIDPASISIITAAPLFLRLAVAPAIAWRADRFAAHAQMIRFLAWTGLGLAAVLTSTVGFWQVLPVAALYAIAIGCIMPLIETIALNGVREEGLHYGRMRLWGSLSFLAANFITGLAIDHLGKGTILWVMIAATAAMAAAAHLLPVSRRALEQLKSQAGPLGAPPAAPAGSAAMLLLRSPVFPVFLLTVGAIQGAHAFFYTFGVLHWQSQGYSAAGTGVLWAFGICAEIVLFANSTALIRRFGAMALLLAGGTAAFLRWTAMAFDPPLAALVVLQAAHALTYAATHVGAMHFIEQAVPARAAGTAQALYGSAAAGVGIGFATLAAGGLYGSLGGAAYGAMALLALGGLAGCVYLARLWQEGSRLA